MYLTYDEYLDAGGDIERPVFDRLCRRACARIDLLTHGRAAKLEPVPDAVKLAAFDAVELLARHLKEDEDGRMQAFSNDGMSVSYAVQTPQERDAALNLLIKGALGSTKAADGRTALLYAGVVA